MVTNVYKDSVRVDQSHFVKTMLATMIKFQMVDKM